MPTSSEILAAAPLIAKQVARYAKNYESYAVTVIYGPDDADAEEFHTRPEAERFMAKVLSSKQYNGQKVKFVELSGRDPSGEYDELSFKNVGRNARPGQPERYGRHDWLSNPNAGEVLKWAGKAMNELSEIRKQIDGQKHEMDPRDLQQVYKALNEVSRMIQGM